MTIKWERKNTEEDKENVITEKESLGNEKKWKGWGEKETTQAEKEVPTLNQASIQALIGAKDLSSQDQKCDRKWER